MSIATTSAPQDNQQITALAQIFAQRILAALPTEYAISLSLHDASGAVHWQSCKHLAAEEQEAATAAVATFHGQVTQSRVNMPIGSGRTAVLLRSADRMGEFSGFIMISTDSRRLHGKVATGRDLPDAVLRAAREWGFALAKQSDALLIPTDPPNIVTVPTRVEDPAVAGATTSSAVAPAGLRQMAGVPAAAAAPPAGARSKVAMPAPEIISAAPLAEEEESSSQVERARQTAELRALQFGLHAQRLVPLQSGARIRRYEVFIRPEWSDDAETSPEELLQKAESQQLGALLDRRVFRHLLQWLRPRLSVWHAAPAQFTLNLATTTVHDQAFIELVEQGLKKAQLPSGLIAFEVDQSLCRREPKRMEALAGLLQRLGSALVIDNFTLHDDSIRLLMLPGLSMVKIDRDLTGEALVSRAGQARLAGLAQMAKVAGVHSVAKKVDGENEHALLAALGVDFAQGFAIAPPAPINAIDSERRLQLIDPSVSELTASLQRPALG